MNHYVKLIWMGTIRYYKVVADVYEAYVQFQ